VQPAIRLLRAGALTALLLTASCASGAKSDSSAPDVAKRVIARSVGGEPGSPPTVVPRPDPAGSGTAANQQFTLSDRTVRVDSASTRPLPRDGFFAVDVALAIRALGPTAIDNLPSDFSLLGRGGDVFGTTSDPAPPFWGALEGPAERRGTVTFEIPIAAGTHLQLLYRPTGAEAPVVFLLSLR